MTSPDRSPARREAFDARTLRQALGNFATGVAVVTTFDAARRPVGLTINSFTSVSLAPPLVLFCLARDSACLEAFRAAPVFAIHVLHGRQHTLSRRFSSKLADRFDGVSWRAGELAAPVIDDVAACFECLRHDVIEQGDHVIFVGRVQCLAHEPADDPLLYFRGGFRSVAAIPPPDIP